MLPVESEAFYSCSTFKRELVPFGFAPDACQAFNSDSLAVFGVASVGFGPVEIASTVEIVLEKAAVLKFTFHKDAIIEISSSEHAIREFTPNEPSDVEERHVPIKIRECARNEIRFDMAPIQFKVFELAITETVFVP